MPWVNILSREFFLARDQARSEVGQPVIPRYVVVGETFMIEDELGIPMQKRMDEWDFNTDTLESRCRFTDIAADRFVSDKHAMLYLLFVAALGQDQYFEDVISGFEGSKVPFDKLRRAVKRALLEKPLNLHEEGNLLCMYANILIFNERYEGAQRSAEFLSQLGRTLGFTSEEAMEVMQLSNFKYEHEALIRSSHEAAMKKIRPLILDHIIQTVSAPLASFESLLFSLRLSQEKRVEINEHISKEVFRGDVQFLSAVGRRILRNKGMIKEEQETISYDEYHQLADACRVAKEKGLKTVLFKGKETNLEEARSILSFASRVFDRDNRSFGTELKGLGKGWFGESQRHSIAMLHAAEVKRRRPPIKKRAGSGSC